MISYCTIPFDPQIVPENYNVYTFGDHISLIPIYLEYEIIYSTCSVHSDFDSSIDYFDHSKYFSSYLEPFLITNYTNESIMEIMMLDDAPWNDNHHHSSLLEILENNIGDITHPILPIYL